jgi:sialate O-acetylesterase
MQPRFLYRMISARIIKLLGIVCIVFLSCYPAKGTIRLPKLIADGMVLQREKKISVWGWASPGEKVSISFNGKSYRTSTLVDGKWLVVLPAMKAGGPYTMDISGTNSIHLKDILIGDVWLCSGQSNMQTQMAEIKENYADEISHAEYPQIRQFLVPNKIDSPQVHSDVTGGQWLPATPVNVLNFSGTAYFFALAVYKKYHVPIGIINASWGGTPIEAWISEDGLKDFPLAQKNYRNLLDTAYINQINAAVNKTNSIERERTSKKYDKGFNGPKTWFDTTYKDNTWRQILVPGYWNDEGIRLNGVVWYRKEINLPKSVIGQSGLLYLGRMISTDEVYVNGKFCGQTYNPYARRRYTIPPNLLKPGKNSIVVRVSCPSGKGGFVPDKPYYLSVGDYHADLTGIWTYKVGQAFTPPEPGAANIQFNLANQPVQLYNVMIAPLLNYGIKGFLWYQGESNTGKAKEYGKLMPALIDDWRQNWGDKTIPFLYVQLPNFMEMQYLPSESQWAELREAQFKTLAIPNTGMAVTIDIGEWNDIHPLNKKDVGYRLALAAEKMAYNETNLVASGPLYQSSVVQGNRIVINFSSVGSGLIIKGGGELSEFAIAGADKKFVWAKAVIEGDKVVVSAAGIDHPMYVRYAWADNPDNANLYNAEGLPASPFRTDGQ